MDSLFTEIDEEFICENCGKYFIPKNKSNEKYCNNIFKNGKTLCR